MVTFPAVQVSGALADHAFDLGHHIGEGLKWGRQKDHVRYAGKIAMVLDDAVRPLKFWVVDAPDMATGPILTFGRDEPQRPGQRLVRHGVALALVVHNAGRPFTVLATKGPVTVEKRRAACIFRIPEWQHPKGGRVSPARRRSDQIADGSDIDMALQH